MPERLSRLVAEARPSVPVEAAAASLLRKVEPPPLPTLAEFARIQEALDVVAVRPRRPSSFYLRAGFALATLLLSIQGGRALMHGRRSAPLRHLASAILERPRATLTVAPPAPPPAVAVPQDSPLALRAGPKPVAQTVPSIRKPSPHAVRVSPPGPTPLAREAAQLAPAQEALADDPARSLTLLSDYRRQFPQGALALEADLVELSADLALRQQKEALPILDRFAENDFAAVQRAPELRVLRGEILAGAHRFEEAQRVFERALALDLAVPLRERALYGRAACLEGLGRIAESRAAFHRYLELYPNGPSSGAATRALGDW